MNNYSYEKFEDLLDEFNMAHFDMYTREDLIDFGAIVVKECLSLVKAGKADAVHEAISRHFGDATL